MKAKWPDITRWAWRASVGGALVAAVMAGVWPSGRSDEAPLKVRALAARVVLVSNTNDNGPGSLRAALEDANSSAGATIRFAIPRNDRGFANGVWTIAPLSALPTIVAASTQIDGSSQTTFGGNTNVRGPEIEIRGDRIVSAATPTPVPTLTPIATPTPGVTPAATPTPAPPANGLMFTAANGLLRGVTINRFPGSGVLITGLTAKGNRIEGCFIGLDATGTLAALNQRYPLSIVNGATDTVIGGATPAARNVVVGGNPAQPPVAFKVHILVIGGRCRIQGNYIGTNASGTSALGEQNPFMEGIAAVSFQPKTYPPLDVQIGGLALGEGNLISGHGSSAITLIIQSGSAVVQGNRIGTDVSGTRAIPNGSGILVDRYGKSPCLIGGPTTGARNVISGNRGAGIAINDRGDAIGTPVFIQNNYIGPAASGTALLGNGGAINLMTSNGVIGALVDDPAPTSKGNRIVGNQRGILVNSVFRATLASKGNVIRGNEIVNNRQTGIDLRGFAFSLPLTFNDKLDVDTGPNRRQNYPVLAFARQSTSLVVGGALGSAPSRSYVLDFYRNDRPHPSDLGQGQQWIGSTRVTTGADGQASFSASLRGRFSGLVTATATDVLTQDTSEFGPDVLISAGAAPLRAPVITSFSPYKAVPGTVLLLDGVNLSTTRSLRIAGVGTVFKVLSDKQVEVTVPAGSRRGEIVLTTTEGVATAPGPFTIVSPSDNDFFVYAAPLTGISGTLTGSTADSTREPGEPVHAGSGTGHSRWYRWTVPSQGQATLQVRTYSGSALAVYTGTEVNRLKLVAANRVLTFGYSDNVVTFAAQSGQTYYIAVDDINQRFDTFTLQWQLSQSSLLTRAGNLPTLSSARADAATQSIRLTFTRALPAWVVSDWTIEVNGSEVATESIAGVGNRLTLGLPEGTLRGGDRIVVHWKAQRIADLVVQ